MCQEELKRLVWKNLKAKSHVSHPSDSSLPIRSSGGTETEQDLPNIWEKFHR
jgi:hypothetical protein